METLETYPKYLGSTVSPEATQSYSTLQLPKSITVQRSGSLLVSNGDRTSH